MDNVIKNFSRLFAIGMQDAANLIQTRIDMMAPAPIFYCESLGTFVGADGIGYIVEITVRPQED